MCVLGLSAAHWGSDHGPETLVSVVLQLGRRECGCLCQHVAYSKYQAAELHVQSLLPITRLGV